MNELKEVPNSIEAEQWVLGGIMLNSTAWDQVADHVKEIDFYKSDHKAIYRAIVALDADSKAIDVVSVSDWLKANGEQVELSYVTEIVNNVFSTANITAHADIVRNKSIERQLLQVSYAIGNIVYGEGDTRQKLDKAQALITQIAIDNIVSGPVMASTIVPKVLDEMERNMKSGGGLTGVPSGFADLDKMTSGLQPSDLIIVAGRPSMGKTSIAMNIAEYAAINQGKTVLVFSMEMSSIQLIQRAIASIGRVPLQSVRLGNLVDEHWPRVTVATKLIIDSKLIIDESPALTVLDIRARARRANRERPLGLIVVDYLQLMNGEGENRNAEITTISRGLKALAKELNVPVIALSQLNRGVENRANHRPMMADLRDSGAIEQDADVILMVYRDEIYNKESEAKGTAEIIIGKQRSGPTGTIRLTFNGEYCRFDNYAGPEIRENVLRPRKWAGGFDD